MPFPTELSNILPGVTEIVAAHINNLEAKVGIDNSAVPTSLDYLVKNPGSLDPGHKHCKLWAADGNPEAVTVDAGGNVGIGTTPSPSQKLVVNGWTHLDGLVGIGIAPGYGYGLKISTGTGHNSIMSDDQGTSEIAVQVGNTMGKIYMGMAATGFPFISIKNGDGSFKSEWIRGNAANGEVYFPGGNVGIGTVSPGKKLDVNGYIRGIGVFNTLNSAPADGDLAAGECAWWFDKTDGAAKLMIKAKQNDGTVKTASISLS
jgi:hypothetical protein